jgi:allantoin racemase
MLLDSYGLGGKLASVRSFDIDADALYPDVTPPDEVHRRVLEVGRRCIDEDGAEVLIPGCTLAGAVLTRFMLEGALDGPALPFVDGMLAGFKLAELWASLAAIGAPFASRVGFYQHPPANQFEQLRRALGKSGATALALTAVTATRS